MADIKKTLETLRGEVTAKIEKYNKALKDKKDFAIITQIEAELKEAELSYAEAKSVEVFGELAKEEDPILAAITAHSYLVLGHKAEREEGVTIGLELIEDKIRQIDLVKFCKFCNLDTAWQFKVEKFNQLLAIRTAKELKMTKLQINKICDSFYMNELAKQIDLGGTPDSNTAICKQLQEVLDSILFKDNGKGKNTYRVNNHDVAYLLMCYTRRGRQVLSIAVAKNAYMHRLIADVAHRVATEKAYDLEYRMVSEKKTKAEKPKTETKKVEAEVVIDRPKADSKPKAKKESKAKSKGSPAPVLAPAVAL